MKYLTKKQVVEKYKEGYRIEPKKNYKNETVSYWMWKKGCNELAILKKTADSMQDNKILDRNYDLKRDE